MNDPGMHISRSAPQPDATDTAPQPADDAVTALRLARAELVDVRREMRVKVNAALEYLHALDGEVTDLRRTLELERLMGDLPGLDAARKKLLRSAFAGDRPVDVPTWLSARLAAFPASEPQPATQSLAERARRIRGVLKE